MIFKNWVIIWFTALMVLFTGFSILGAEPIRLAGAPVRGDYIGKHVSILSEKDLFTHLAEEWQIDAVFKEKLLSGELHSSGQVQFRIEDVPSGYRAHMNLVDEPDRKQTAEWGVNDVRNAEIADKFIPSNKNIFNLDFTPHSYWLHLQVDNENSSEQGLVLELDRHLFSYAHLYSIRDREIEVQRGDFINTLQQRKIKHKNIAFQIKAQPGINDFYIRVDSWYSDVIPLRLWSDDSFREHKELDLAILGIMLGVFLFIFAYNLFIFFTVRDYSYIYLSMMTLCGLAIHLSTTGLGFQLVWPENPLMDFHLLYLAMPLSFAFFLLFCRSFIEISGMTPKVDRVLMVMTTLFMIIAALFFVLDVGTRGAVFGAIFLIDHIYYLPVLIPTVIAIKRGHRTGIFLLIGILLQLLSGLEWLLSNRDIVPYYLINYLNIKGVFLLVIMTLGLADKINVMKRSLTDLNVNLESKVRARTSELSKKTDELLDANIKLKEMDKLKTRFFANVSHELRTPLTLILAPIDSFLKGDYGKLANANRYIFDSMKRNGERLLKLINDLLDFSKIEADRMVVKKNRCNLSNLLSYCLSSIEASANSQEIEISFSDSTGGLEIQVDPDLIEKAVFNLLSNAMKFNQPGGSVRISLSQERDNCVIKVEDSGIGIPGDKLETIFERFGQVDDSATRKYEGTGIGLALTREIVQLHDGEITVSSQVGRGSEFTILLPAQDWERPIPALNGLKPTEAGLMTSPVTSFESKEELGKKRPPRSTEELSPKSVSDQATILIVDDNPDMVAYLDQLLVKSYQTITAANGKEALQKWENLDVDLVLADLMMPEMDGYELLQKLRSDGDNENLPVIFLTAKTDTPGKVKGFEKGANDYITKPFDPDELLARVKSQLKFRQLRETLLESLKKDQSKKTITETTRIKIETVKAFLKENYGDEISRDGIATAVDMSPDHLGRTFKELTGERILDYLNKIRIAEASTRLKTSNDKITDIAFDVGFGSLRSFNKVFRDIAGLTPSAFRKK